MEVNFRGINYVEKENDEIFTVRFEVTTNSWDTAEQIKEIIENKLKNILTNQSTLK